IETHTLNKTFLFINEGKDNKLVFVSTLKEPEVVIEKKDKKGEKSSENLVLSDFIEVKGWKAAGNKIGNQEIVKIIPVAKEEDNGDDSETPVNSEENTGGEKPTPVVLEIKPEDKPVFPKEVTQGNLF